MFDSQTILWNTVAVECQGDGDLLNNLRIKNTHSGAESDLAVNGLFYAIGTYPFSPFPFFPPYFENTKILPLLSHPCLSKPYLLLTNPFDTSPPSTTGHEPATTLVRDQLQTDADGYIITVPGTTQTSIKGVFAAGDVQDKRYRQAITSAGSGCMAALEVEQLIAEEEELGDE